MKQFSGEKWQQSQAEFCLRKARNQTHSELVRCFLLCLPRAGANRTSRRIRKLPNDRNPTIPIPLLYESLSFHSSHHRVNAASSSSSSTKLCVKTHFMFCFPSKKHTASCYEIIHASCVPASESEVRLKSTTQEINPKHCTYQCIAVTFSAPSTVSPLYPKSINI
jgi:hypothetical protein